MPTDVRGNGSNYDTQAVNGAYWGIYDRGDDQETTGIMAGSCSRALTSNLGHGSRTQLNSRGPEAQIATQQPVACCASASTRGRSRL